MVGIGHGGWHTGASAASVNMTNETFSRFAPVKGTAPSGNATEIDRLSHAGSSETQQDTRET